MSVEPEPDSAPRDRLAEELRGRGPLGVLATLVIGALGPVLEPLGAILALLWARRTRTPWRDLGLARPRSWAWTIALGVLGGGAFKLAMKSIVMPLLGAPPINEAYRWLTGNTAALPGMIFAVVVGAGFGEELVFRGFLFERFGRLLGAGRLAQIAIVAITSLWFGWVHVFGQGLPGAQQATIVGLVYGTIYARTRQLWPLIVAHAAFDLVAVALIYWNLETQVAHWFFAR